MRHPGDEGRLVATLEGALREAGHDAPFRQGLVERGFEPAFQPLTAAMLTKAAVRRTAIPRIGITPE